MDRRFGFWVLVFALSAACGGRTTGPELDTHGDDEPTPGESEPTASSGSDSAKGGDAPSTSPAITSTTAATPDTVGTSSDIIGDDESILVISPAPPTCEELCGNRVVDSCETCTGVYDSRASSRESGSPLLGIVIPPDRICTTTTEVCDGAVSPEQTCEALGFVGGTLGCNARCNYDDAQCHTCLTSVEQPVCRDDLGAGQRPSFVALATNSTQLVAAWDEEACHVGLSWFDGELRTLHSRRLIEAFCMTDPLSPGPHSNITLAPLADRWLMEVGTKQFILSADGETVSHRYTTGNALFAASRSGEPPLVVRDMGDRGVTASLLDSAGNEVWTRELTKTAIEPRYGSAVAVASGFLVALRADQGVSVFHLDGATGAIVETSSPGSSNTEYPQLGSAGGETRLVWTEFGEMPQRVMWAKLDGQGRRLGEPIVIGELPEYFNRSPIAVDGTDTVVLFGGYTGITGVGKATHVRRLDAVGATLAGDVANQVDPNFVQSPQVVLFDGAIVTAWVGQGDARRVGLARVEL